MFKRLNSEDIVVGTFPIIEPAGADFGGILVDTTDYTITSANIAGAVTGSQRVYRQFANIIQGDATSYLPVGATFNAVTLIRNKFKESISPRTFSIGGIGIDTGSLTFTEAGRQYESTDSTYYLYPDIGVALTDPAVTTVTGIKACSEESKTFTNIFVRINNQEFNYSTNPSFSDEDGYVRFIDFVDNPKTYITTIGFYDDNGDCLAVTKVDKPTEKSFTKDILFSIQLKF